MRSVHIRPLTTGATLFLFVLFGLMGCQTVHYVRPAPPTLEELVEWKKQGKTDEYLISKIGESEGRYYLKAEAVEYLTQNGISRNVIDFLLGTAWAPSRVYHCYDCGVPWHWHAGYWSHHHHHWHW